MLSPPSKSLHPEVEAQRLPSRRPSCRHQHWQRNSCWVSGMKHATDEDAESHWTVTVAEACLISCTLRAQVLAAQRMLEAKYNEAARGADDWARRAELAVRSGNDDLAREALRRKKAFAVRSIRRSQADNFHHFPAMRMVAGERPTTCCTVCCHILPSSGAFS